MVVKDCRKKRGMRLILSKGLTERRIWLECESETRGDGVRLGRMEKDYGERIGRIEEDFVTYGHVSHKTKSYEDMCHMTCSLRTHSHP